MTENIILSYPEDIFTVFIPRLKPETQTMDGICSLPHDYGTQMKFNSPNAQGGKPVKSVQPFQQIEKYDWSYNSSTSCIPLHTKLHNIFVWHLNKYGVEKSSLIVSISDNYDFFHL